MVVSVVENWNGMPASSQIVTPQKDNGQWFGQPTSQIHHGSANSQINKGQWNYVRGRVNHVTAEQVQDDPDFVLDTFPVNPVPTTILFDSGASYSFNTE
jgi:hypothetical protein